MATTFMPATHTLQSSANGSLLAKLTSNNPFPFQIYDPNLVSSLKSISLAHNIPMEYLGIQILYSIGALSGNMYHTYIGGIVKPIIFIAKIGPSGVGKT